jgi:hypothetical protein
MVGDERVVTPVPKTNENLVVADQSHCGLCNDIAGIRNPLSSPFSCPSRNTPAPKPTEDGL